MPLLRRTKITLLQNEIVQNKPGSAIREGGSQAAGFARLKGRHAATTENSRQARSATQTNNLAQKRFRRRVTALQEFRNKKFPATRECSLRTIFFGNSPGLIRTRYFSLALRTPMLCSETLSMET